MLKTTPIGHLQNKHLLIQSNVATPNEVIKLWEEKHNARLQVKHRPLKDMTDRIDADKNDFFATLLQELFSGRGAIGGKDNELYPGWKPDSIESVL